jgi:hypothetical protein
MKLRHIAGIVAALAVGQAQAAHVAIFGEQLSGFNKTTIDNFYDGITGGNSQIISTLDSASLSGVGLLWVTQPNAFTASQLSTMQGFLAGGGRIAFMGEHGGFGWAQDVNINTALTFLGAHVQIQQASPDAGFRSASVLDGQIKANPLTAGVNTYQYACFAPLILSGAAQTLMTGEDNPSQVMMAYENIGSGSIFLITDQNVWDYESSGWPGYDNGQMFENLLLADTGAPPVNGVPEPGTALLASLGLLGLSAIRRRK